jgi:hypothetical protein
MSVNFFKAECQQQTAADEFGLCDNGPNSWAYLTEDKQTTWICKVLNPVLHQVEFTAIDKCIHILRDDGNDESSCDCMLTYPENIVFLELTESGKRWKEESIAQIESTLERFPTNELARFRHKRAFVANRRHPDFHVIDVETKQRFFRQYRVRINVEAEIIL